MTQVSTLPPTSRGQKTRQKLVEAAEVEFAELGYERASITGIVSRSDVAQGTFYVYFPDKKSIFIELVDSLSVRLRRFLTAAVAGSRDRMEVERAGLRAFLDFCAQHRGLYRIVPQAEFVDEACYRRYYRCLADGYVRGLKSAMDKGELRRLDPEITAHCLMGLTDMIGQNFVLWQPGVRRDKLIDAVMEFVAHGIAPAPAAPIPLPAPKRSARARAGEAKSPRSRAAKPKTSRR